MFANGQQKGGPAGNESIKVPGRWMDLSKWNIFLNHALDVTVMGCYGS